ncbi:MAG: hypothetical protein ACJ74T_00705 [Pyrinomonadaceae bacterium]
MKDKGVPAPPPRASGRVFRRWLLAALSAAVLVPCISYLKYGEVRPLIWGTTVFLVALCLLAGVGFYFAGRTEYHTQVEARGGWADRVGAFWLLACGLGPFFGWTLANAFTLTEGNWRWLYWGRVGLSVGLPVLTALPLLRYVGGRGAPLMLALLLGVTALPLWSAWATTRDLCAGPSNLLVRSPAPGLPDAEYRYLSHTNRVLEGR